jgi:hypothetical protein
MRNTYRVLVISHERKRQIGRCRVDKRMDE